MTVYYLSRLQNANAISLGEFAPFEEKLQAAVGILSVVTLVFVFGRGNGDLGTLKLMCNAVLKCRPDHLRLVGGIDFNVKQQRKSATTEVVKHVGEIILAQLRSRDDDRKRVGRGESLVNL